MEENAILLARRLWTDATRVLYRASTLEEDGAPRIVGELRRVAQLTALWQRLMPPLPGNVVRELFSQLEDALAKTGEHLESGDMGSATYWATYSRMIAEEVNREVGYLSARYKLLAQTPLILVLIAVLMVPPLAGGLASLGDLMVYLAGVVMAGSALAAATFSPKLASVTGALALLGMVVSSGDVVSLGPALILLTVLTTSYERAVALRPRPVRVAPPAAPLAAEEPVAGDEELLASTYRRIYGDRWREIMEYDLRNLMKQGLTREQAVARRLKELGLSPGR